MKTTPLLQNDLDGTCGLMSVMNSLTYLFPNDFQDSESISTTHFKNILINSISNFKDFWNNGCEKNQIEKFLKISSKELEKYNKTIYYSNLENLVDFIEDEYQFWKIMKLILTDKKSCAIVGFSDPEPHWTVITNITDKLIFFDSTGIKEYKINKTVLGETKQKERWEFDIKDIFIIKRSL